MEKSWRKSVRADHTGLWVILVSTLMLLGILVFAALISLKLYKRFDLTEMRQFSLSGQGVQVLKELKRKVQAIGFYTPDHWHKERTLSLLRLFSAESKNFNYEMVDPERNPGRTRAYGKILSDMVVIESGGRWEKVIKPDEISILSALVRVTSERQRVVYFTNGHGEKALEDTEGLGFRRVKDLLEKQGYKPEVLDLTSGEKIPEDASLVMIAGPTKDFFKPELKKLAEYLKTGGSLMILVDPQKLPNLEGFCAHYDIVLGEDVIVDKESRLFGSDNLMPVVKNYGEHEITSNLQLITFFPLVRSVQISEKRQGTITLYPLALTSNQSWAESDLSSLFTKNLMEFDELKDKRGPLPVAVAGEIQFQNPGSGNFVYARLVVVGDSDFAANAYFDQGGNGDLFINSVHWLCKEKEMIASRPPDREFLPIVLTPLQVKLVFWVAAVLFPASILLAGMMVLRRGRWRS